MSYDEPLAERVRQLVARYPKATEKAMFGGVCFMLNGHMCVGIARDDLMVRVGPDAYEHALGQRHARPMDFTGRPMRGYVFVEPDGCRDRRALERWITRAVDFVSTLPPKPSGPTRARRGAGRTRR